MSEKNADDNSNRTSLKATPLKGSLDAGSQNQLSKEGKLASPSQNLNLDKPFQQSGIGFRPQSQLEKNSAGDKAGKQRVAGVATEEDDEVERILESLETNSNGDQKNSKNKGQSGNRQGDKGLTPVSGTIQRASGASQISNVQKRNPMLDLEELAKNMGLEEDIGQNETNKPRVGVSNRKLDNSVADGKYANIDAKQSGNKTKGHQNPKGTASVQSDFEQDYDELARVLGITKDEFLNKLKEDEERQNQLEPITEEPEAREQEHAKKIVGKKDLPAETNKKPKAKTFEDEYDELAHILEIGRKDLITKLEVKEPAENITQQMEEKPKQSEKSPVDEYQELADVLDITKERLLELLKEMNEKKQGSDDPSKAKSKRTLEDDYNDLAGALGIPKNELKTKVQTAKKEDPGDSDAYFSGIVSKKIPEGNHQHDSEAQGVNYDEIANILGVERSQLMKQIEEVVEAGTKETEPYHKKHDHTKDEYQQLAEILDMPKLELMNRVKLARSKQWYKKSQAYRRRFVRTVEEGYEDLAEILGMQKYELKEKIRAKKKKLHFHTEELLNKVLDGDLPKEISEKKGYLHELEEFEKELNLKKQLKEQKQAENTKVIDDNNDAKHSDNHKRNNSQGKRDNRTIEQDYDELAKVLGMNQEMLAQKLKEIEEENKREEEKREKEAALLREKEQKLLEEQEKLEQERKLERERQEEEERRLRQQHAEVYAKQKMDELEKLKSKYQLENPRAMPSFGTEGDEISDYRMRSAESSRDVQDISSQRRQLVYEPIHVKNKGEKVDNYDGSSGTGLRAKGKNYPGAYQSSGREGNSNERLDSQTSTARGLIALDPDQAGESERGKGKPPLPGKRSSAAEANHTQNRKKYLKWGTLEQNAETTILDRNTQTDLSPLGSQGIFIDDNSSRGGRNNILDEIAEDQHEESPLRSKYLSKREAKYDPDAVIQMNDQDFGSQVTKEHEGDISFNKNYDVFRNLGDEFEIADDENPCKKLAELGLDPEEWEEIEITEEIEVEVTLTDETEEDPDLNREEFEEEKADNAPILISQTPTQKKKKVKKITRKEVEQEKKMKAQRHRDRLEQYLDNYGFLEALARNTLRFPLASEEVRDQYGDKDSKVQNVLYRSYLVLRWLGRFFSVIINAMSKPIDFEELVHPRAYVKVLKGAINIRVTKNIALLVAFFTLMMTIYCIAVADAGDISRVRNDDKKSWVAHRLVPGAVIFTYYGIIMLELRSKLKLLLLFLIQCVAPGVILIIDLANWYAAGRVDLPFKRMCTCIYFVAIYLFWFVTKTMKDDCIFAYNWRFSLIFAIFWFALVFVWITGFAIYYSITPRAYNNDWAYSYITFLAIPTMILTAVTWVYWHFRFLNIPSKIQLMDRIADENKRKLFRDFKDNNLPIVDQVKLIRQKVNVVSKEPEFKYSGNQKLETLLKQLDEQDEREQAIVLKKKNVSFDLNTSVNTTNINSTRYDSHVNNVSSMELTSDEPKIARSTQIPRRKPQKLCDRISRFIRNQYRSARNHIILVSSIAMGGTTLVLMGLIIIYLLEKVSLPSITKPEMFYLSVFLYFFTPLFLILGFLLVSWRAKHKVKNTYIPILAAYLPMFVTMPLSNAMVKDSTLSEIGNLLVFLPALSVSFWLSIGYFFLKHRKTRTGLVAFLFVFFYIPLIVIHSMRNVNGFESLVMAGEIAEYVLVGIGGATVAAIFLYLVVRVLIMDEAEIEARYSNTKFQIMTMFRWNIQYWGFWVNSLGMIVSSAITLWSYFHASRKVSQSLRGFVLGLTLVYLQTFYISNLALRLHVVRYRKDITRRILSFDDRFFVDQDTHSQRISNFIENNDLKPEQLQQIRENRKLTSLLIITHVGLLIPLFVALAVIFAIKDFKQPFYVFLTLSVGTSVNLCLYYFYNKWKKYNPISAKFVVPAVITYVWTAFVFPLGAILPAANVFYGVNSEDFPKLQRITVGTIAIWILVTVALLAIIASLFTKRLEFDRKVRFISNFMRKELDRIAVKSDSYILRTIYEDWINQGEKHLSKQLKEHGKPTFWWPIPKTCHLTQYSKMLIDHDAYRKLRIRFKRKMEGEAQDDLDRDALDLTKKKPSRGKKCCDDARPCGRCGEYCFPTVDEWGNPIVDPNASKPVDLDNEPLEFAPRLEEILAVDFNDFQKVDLSGNDLLEEDNQNSDEEDYDPEGYAEDASVMGHKIEIMGVDFWPLDPRVYRAMIVYCFAVKVHVNQETKLNFLKSVFRIFAIGDWRKHDERWLDYLGYKKMLELSGIIPSRDFPDYMIDVIYSKYCYSERGDKYQHINWERFEGLVTEVAKRKYPNEKSEREALSKLIRYYMYPNLLHLLPSMHKAMPDEWRYMSYLINKYRKMAMRRRKLKALGFTKEEIDRIMALSDAEIDAIIANKEREIEEAKRKAALEQEEEANFMQKEGENFSLIVGDEKYGGEGRGSSRKRKPWSKCRKCMIFICHRSLNCWRAVRGGCLMLINNLFFFDPTKNKPSSIENYLEDVRIQEEEEREHERFDEAMEKGRNDDEFAEDEEGVEEEKSNNPVMNFNEVILGEGGDVKGVGKTADAPKKMKYKKKLRKIYDHKPSPDWPVIVDVMMAAIQVGEKEYRNVKEPFGNLPWKCSFSNVVALFVRLISIYAIGSFAFSPSIDWKIPTLVLEIIESVNGFIGQENYQYLYFACLGASICYVVLCMNALRDAKRGLLGTNRKGNRARFPQLKFFQSQWLNILSQAAFIMIMRTFINVFSCDYTSDPFSLYSDLQIVCSSTKHKVLMGVAVAGMLLYYPLASFLYPNLQFADEGDDLKYEPTFVVIETQAKLFLAGFAGFFPDAATITTTLGVVLGFSLCLAALNKITVPCVVRVIVPWETGLYVAMAWFCACGIFVHETGYYLIGWFAVAGGFGVIGVLSCIGACKVSRYLKKQKKYNSVANSSAKADSKSKDSSSNNIEVQKLQAKQVAALNQSFEMAKIDKGNMPVLTSPSHQGLIEPENPPTLDVGKVQNSSPTMSPKHFVRVQMGPSNNRTSSQKKKNKFL